MTEWTPSVAKAKQDRVLRATIENTKKSEADESEKPFLQRSSFVSCVRTQIHVTACLFVRICLHVAYTNKNLGIERVTTFLTHTSS
jgi:hypothetical protein